MGATPKTRTVPPRAARETPCSKVRELPTASMTASKPSPQVASSIAVCQFGSRGSLARSAPNPKASCRRNPSASLTTINPEPNHPGTQHQHRGSGLHAQLVHTVNATRQRLRETTHARLERRGQMINDPRGYDFAFRKAPVRVDAISPQLRAEMLPARPAEAADGAKGIGLDSNEVAFTKTLHFCSHGFDEPGNLVAQHHGSGGRELAVQNVCVGSTNPDGQRSNAHLIRSQIGYGQFFQA